MNNTGIPNGANTQNHDHVMISPNFKRPKKPVIHKDGYATNRQNCFGDKSNNVSNNFRMVFQGLVLETGVEPASRLRSAGPSSRGVCHFTTPAMDWYP